MFVWRVDFVSGVHASFEHALKRVLLFLWRGSVAPRGFVHSSRLEGLAVSVGQPPCGCSSRCPVLLAKNSRRCFVMQLASTGSVSSHCSGESWGFPDATRTRCKYQFAPMCRPLDLSLHYSFFLLSSLTENFSQYGVSPR